MQDPAFATSELAYQCWRLNIAHHCSSLLILTKLVGAGQTESSVPGAYGAFGVFSLLQNLSLAVSLRVFQFLTMTFSVFSAL